MSNWLLELAVAIDQKSSDVAIATKQTKSHIKVFTLQPTGIRVIGIALGWGKDKDAVGAGSYAVGFRAGHDALRPHVSRARLPAKGSATVQRPVYQGNSPK
jgi:hypothetical protein